MYTVTEFNEYQDIAHKKLVFPAIHKDLYLTTGLQEEVGEVSKEFRKRLEKHEPMNKEFLTKELGDVLWYLSVIAQDNGITLEEIANSNLSKLNERGLLSQEDSKELRVIQRIETGVIEYIPLIPAGFGGTQTHSLQVLQSNAGFYIGTLSLDEDIGWTPESRDSEEYYDTREQAENALINRTYTVRMNP